AEDLVGYKVRVAPTPIFVDLFKSLGASPVALDAVEVYSACQTHLVDGVELPLVAIEGFRLFEVQKYLSITNHLWNGSWICANPAAWNALPPDLQRIVEANLQAYVQAERRSMLSQDAATGDKL